MPLHRALRARLVTLVLVGASVASGGIAHAAAPSTTTTAPVAVSCASSVGPGIPAPASVPSGISGFHAAWYGQSGYMTLCPGDTAFATVAMYNSGSLGWVSGVLGQVAYLGTSNPTPGQDQPSAFGGDGTRGTPNTGWPRYNRVAIQPAPYVGPSQVAWFQFAVKAPSAPGSYGFYIRPVIEGAQWMEDYGIFWQITVPGPAAAGSAYTDDRSTAASELGSFYDAVNRREYLRAYDYWETPSVLGSFDAFRLGYAQTTSVTVSPQRSGSDSGAGQLYWAIGALLTAQMSDGTTQLFSACYTFHLARPEIQTTVPFLPLAIKSGTVRAIATIGELNAALDADCAAANGRPSTGTGATAPPVTDAVDPSIYRDDRSTGVQVVRSYYSAINRHEYPRAYGYWESGAAVAPYPQFSGGFANTVSVLLTTGAPTTGAGAGQLYESVPTGIQSYATDGSVRTYVGCYRLHLSSPSAQATAPFQPFAIQSANVNEVPNGSSIVDLLKTACAAQ